MRKGKRIRSELNPNQENRRSVRLRNKESQFGIFRPLTPECVETIMPTLGKVQKDANELLANSPSNGANFGVRPKQGATFLEQRSAHQALKRKQIDTRHVQDIAHAIGDRNYRRGRTIEVSIDGFDWFGGNSRKGGALIDTDVSGELRDEVEELEEVLRNAGAVVLLDSLSEPTHVSLAQYKGPKQTHIRIAHQAEINDIFTARFEEDGIGSLVLGQTVVGQGYDEPLNNPKLGLTFQPSRSLHPSLVPHIA